MKRNAAHLLAALVTGLVLLLVAPTAASAHDDNANLTFESDPATDAGPLALDLRVGATYSIDGELVESATMSVTGTGPDGATLPATPLAAVPENVGLYGAELTFPVGGAWSLTVTSTEPAGELAVQVEVPAEEASTTTVAEQTTTTAPATGDESGEVEEDEATSTGLILGTIVVVVVLAAIVVYFALRRRKADGNDGTL
jgi:hypothetical protein